MSIQTNRFLVAGICCVLSSIAHAQWGSDSTMHLVVADGPGEQVQPKIAPTSDGGCYLSWFSSQTGYDVRLQRLDNAGNEMWAHNGILIADRGFSSTQDYDLDVDSSGHAVIVFRDDRFGGVKITAQRIAPDGTVTWGANGIQFGNGSDFVASPDIATTSDGNTVIAWINNADTHLAQIDQAGTIQWNTILSDPGGDTINVASMHGSDTGSVMISWVQYTTFLGAKSLYAQKIASDGTEAWGSRVAVFDGGSLQFGNFPEFVSDGSGGAVFSWYDTAANLNVFAQHLDIDGLELYPHNGAAVSTAFRERVSPTAAYDPVEDAVYVSWVELENNQGDSGVFAQRLDNKGSRMWSDSGVEISNIDGNQSSSLNVQVAGGNMVTLWIENTGSFGLDQVHAHALTPAGTDAWSSGTVLMASDLGNRSRLTSAMSSDGFIIAGWQIGDTGDGDIETHNLNADGTLGASSCPADLNGDGNLDFFDVSAFLNAFSAMNPIADFNKDGFFNFFDVSAFLNAFAAGCP
ncbi:MAG: GC-type dockerin domain-anchored protein [Phycisphaerales bacterium]